MIAGIANVGALGTGEVSVSSSSAITADEISKAFLYLLLIQGLFSGLTIGKLSEGDIRAGVKHSFALVVLSFLISAGASVIFGK